MIAPLRKVYTAPGLFPDASSSEVMTNQLDLTTGHCTDRGLKGGLFVQCKKVTKFGVKLKVPICALFACLNDE